MKLTCFSKPAGTFADYDIKKFLHNAGKLRILFPLFSLNRILKKPMCGTVENNTSLPDYFLA